ncbi:unnamed protein product [Oikopleura dioica]|uniref:RNA polymerase sigma factor 70 region 4 type 2 domain-containing protein n=1 Tax=Oikopleura dioica TaxID=34765 RepID=E4XU18_OIKDI|nr:unnamed protein product [Oikopleura dioica]
MVNDAHLAKDVSQGVFVALAKDSGKLSAHPVLSGWLHATTRNIAAQTIRTEARRRKREQQAAAMNDSSETHAAWDEIAPHLDAALSELPDPDRDAVLLRYFENQSAKDMAAVLGISPEAAQKRVNRGVEKLRDNFAKRGLTAGTAGLAGAISANAVQAAPAGFAALVSSAAIVTTTSGTVAATTIFAMTTLQKALIVTTISASLGIAVYQTSHATKLQSQNRDLQQTNARISSEIAVLRGGSKASVETSRIQKHLEDKKERMAARVAIEMTEEMREAGMLGKKNAPNHSLLGEDGRITLQAIREAGISQNKADAIQKILDDKWKEVSQRLSKNVHFDEGASDPENGKFAYDIPALPDGGAEYVTQMESNIRGIAGVSAGNRLLDAFNPNSYLCGFGKYDVRVELYLHGEHGRNDSPMATFSFTYPKTSRVVKSGKVSQEGFREHFGFILDDLPTRE